MSYRVVLSDRAEADVQNVLLWFRNQQATRAGARWLDEFLRKLTTLETRPERCVVVPEGKDLRIEIREILLGRGRHKYRIFFQISRQTVSILRVWHSSRDAMTRDDLLE